MSLQIGIGAKHRRRAGHIAVALVSMTLGIFASAADNPADHAISKGQQVPFTVYAAGSLRDVMHALADEFAAERRGAPAPVKFLFGPSGKLRERIEAGEPAHVFASASPEYTDRLKAAGKLRSSNVFAGNSLCVLARPGMTIATDTLVDTLLSPDVVVGTSTPGADPSGDYAWQMFQKIGAQRAGAFEQLDRKARKLTGGEINNGGENTAPYARLLMERKADVFVTYCTNALAARAAVPALTWVTVPPAFNVAAAYAIGLAAEAPESAREFVRYVLSQRAQKVTARFGFSPPVAGCVDVEPMLKAAHAAWLGKADAVDASPSAPGREVASGQHLALTLAPAATLKFAQADAKSTNTWGGVVSFVAPRTGHLEVFTDQRAWIDIVRSDDGSVAAAIRSDRWLGCAGVGKNLGFQVVAGVRYQLRLTRVESARIGVLLMPMAVAAASGTAVPASPTQSQ